jgi:hypothetical protein
MKVGLVDSLRPLSVRGTRAQRWQFNQGPVVPLPHLELSVERAVEGSRRCRRCADVQGQYVCIPSPAVRNEWRHSDTGVEILVHMLTCQPGTDPRLHAMILVNNGSQLHARAVYSGKLSTTKLQDGPWTLELISEKSECDFVFPGQVEIASSGKPATQTRSAPFRCVR